MSTINLDAGCIFPPVTALVEKHVPQRYAGQLKANGQSINLSTTTKTEDLTTELLPLLHSPCLTQYAVNLLTQDFYNNILQQIALGKGLQNSKWNARYATGAVNVLTLHQAASSIITDDQKLIIVHEALIEKAPLEQDKTSTFFKFKTVISGFLTDLECGRYEKLIMEAAYTKEHRKATGACKDQEPTLPTDLSAYQDKISHIEASTNDPLADQRLNVMRQLQPGLQNWIRNSSLSGEEKNRSQSALCMFNCLQYDQPILDLSYKMLTSIPAAIGLLSHVTEINLSNNQISSLPPAIFQLTHLNRLLLTYNQLTDIPQDIACLSGLNTLTLNGNPFTKFPEAVLALPDQCTILFDKESFDAATIASINKATVLFGD